MKQCPRCARLNEDSKEKCKCGFGFNQPELTFEEFKRKYVRPVRREEITDESR